MAVEAIADRIKGGAAAILGAGEVVGELGCRGSGPGRDRGYRHLLVALGKSEGDDRRDEPLTRGKHAPAPLSENRSAVRRQRPARNRLLGLVLAQIGLESQHSQLFEQGGDRTLFPRGQAPVQQPGDTADGRLLETVG